MNVFVKINDVRDKLLDFAIFVVWSVNYVLAESLECKGSILSSCFFGQSANYYSHVFSLVHSCMSYPSKKRGRRVSLWFNLVAFVLHVNQENWGLGIPRFITPIVKSFPQTF